MPADVMLGHDVGDMIMLGAHEKNRTANRHRTVHLAGMDDAGHGISDRDDVHVGSRQRIQQLRARLVRQRDNVASGGFIDLLFADSAADEHEEETRIVGESLGSVKDGGQGTRGSVIPAVHDDPL